MAWPPSWYATLALGAGHDPVDGFLDLLHRDGLLVAAGGEQRRLVDRVREIGAGEPGRAACEHLEVDGGVERFAPGVYAQDRLATFQVGPVDHDLTVEAPGAQQRGVEDVGAVRRGHEDDGGTLVEAVHLDEQLVERLLALVVPPAEPRPALAAHGVDLVDEHDGGRARLRLLEEIAHTGRTHAHEHLHEVGPRDREERHARLAGDCAGEQGLAGAGGPEEQHPPGDLGPHRLELRGVLQVVLDLLQFLDRLVDAGDVTEGGLGLVLGHRLVAAAPELHHAPPAPLGAVHHEQQDAPDEQHRQDDGDERADQRVGLLRVDLGRHVGLAQQRGEVVGVLGGVGRAVLAAVGQRAGHGLIAVVDDRVDDAALLDRHLELAQPELVARGLATHQRDDEQEDEGTQHDPRRGGACGLLQRGLGLLAQRALLGGEDASGPTPVRRAGPFGRW
jgi:hypothetical protein